MEHFWPDCYVDVVIFGVITVIFRSNGGRMLPQLSPWDVNGALARTCEAAAAALQQLLTRELAEWKGLALAVRPRYVHLWLFKV